MLVVALCSCGSGCAVLRVMYSEPVLATLTLELGPSRCVGRYRFEGDASFFRRGLSSCDTCEYTSCVLPRAVNLYPNLCRLMYPPPPSPHSPPLSISTPTDYTRVPRGQRTRRRRGSVGDRSGDHPRAPSRTSFHHILRRRALPNRRDRQRDGGIKKFPVCRGFLSRGSRYQEGGRGRE